ncbi:MAG: tripartite tricarboxylate transporter TctB family protein [Pseudomonadota bacterium]
MILKGKPNFNTVAGIVCVLFSILLYIIIPFEVDDPPTLFGQSASDLDPKLFPRIVSVLFFLIGIWYIVESFGIREKNDFKLLKKDNVLNIAVSVIVLFFYALTLERLGFVISSFIVTIALTLYYGSRNIIGIIGVTIVVPVGIYYIFTRWLQVYLPAVPDF